MTIKDSTQLPEETALLGHDLAKRVEDVLRDEHKGIQNAIKSPALMRRIFGFEAGARDSNNRHARALRIAICEINGHGGLICSTPTNGYWWANSLKDGLPAAAKKVTRALNQLQAARQLDRNLRIHFGGQVSLEEAQHE